MTDAEIKDWQALIAAPDSECDYAVRDAACRELAKWSKAEDVLPGGARSREGVEEYIYRYNKTMYDLLAESPYAAHERICEGSRHTYTAMRGRGYLTEAEAYRAEVERTYPECFVALLRKAA